jgi:hypothetical protein
MAFNTGAGTKVAIGKEGSGSWGTPVADTMLINFSSESMTPELTKTEEENLLAGYGPSAFDVMALKAGGEISAVLKPENAGYLMYAAMGGTDTVTAPSGQQMHSMVMQTASGALRSFTIYVDRKQAIKRYSGCKMASLKISAKAGDYVKISSNWKGKDESTSTITTSTIPSLKAYKFIGATVVAGGTTLDVTGFDLEYDNQLEEGPQTSGSGLYATEPAHGKRKITVTIEMPYDTNSESIYTTNYITDTVISSIVLHLESPSIIATTYKYRMDITLNNVAITSVTNNVGAAGIIMASITGEATEVGATKPMTAVIYDATATAYSA